MNKLYYGDNLAVLREYVADASVDLVYLDPPFNSNATYNVLFKAPDGHSSQAQIEAFDDTWHWTDAAEQAFDEVIQSGRTDAAEMLRAMRAFLGENDMMAYLAMMAVRLIELHRVLKPTGSLYLHCDPTASHYLKILLDAVFGSQNFRSELVWRRNYAHNDAKQGSKQYGSTHDLILFYTRSKTYTWNWLYTEYDGSYVKSFYRHIDEITGKRYREGDLTAAKPGGDVSYDWPVMRRKSKVPAIWVPDFEGEFRDPKEEFEYKIVRPYTGRYWAYSLKNMMTMWGEGKITHRSTGMPVFMRFIDDQPGVPLQDIWTDINPLTGGERERLGYPTQKPVALLERILSASSNEGDLVLDPFCGCGTTVHAAQNLKRRWIGIDVTHLAIGLIRKRLRDAFPQAQFEIVGVPRDLDGARALAAQDKYEFQKWALMMIEAQPWKSGKKGGDGGVDGVIYVKPDGKRDEKVIISVKGGAQLNPSMIKDLVVTVDQQGAKMGVFLTLEPPTKGMVTQAAAAGLYKTEFGVYPKIQIVTVEQLFQPANPLNIPWQNTAVFRKAKREASAKQESLDL